MSTALISTLKAETEMAQLSGFNSDALNDFPGLDLIKREKGDKGPTGATGAKGNKGEAGTCAHKSTFTEPTHGARVTPENGASAVCTP